MEPAEESHAPPPVPWPKSGSADEAADILADELEDWILSAVERHRDRPWQGIHDEGTFASSWFAFHMIRPREEIRRFLISLRDSFLDWANTGYYHGYYPRHEVHHGPENVLYFQSRFAALDPEDPVTRDIIEDVAHHAGNWAGGVPEWFDWDTRTFRSVILGTRDIDPSPARAVNIAEHFRFVLIALASYRLTENRRYLDWAEAYARNWLDAFERHQDVPVALHPAMSESELGERFSRIRKSFLGAAPSDLGRRINRVESHVANGTIDALLDLYYLTGRDIYSTWARRLLRELVPTLAGTHNHPTGLLLMKHRVLTGDTSLDDGIMGVLGEVPRDNVAEYSWEPSHTWTHEERTGPGKRHDMIRWMIRREGGEWMPDTSPSPAALMLAFQISGDDGFAKRSLELACARLRAAKENFDDGRKHGCADRTVSAVVRGNGRCHNAGNVTGSLFPYKGGLYDMCTIPTRVKMT
jgi:hypothetical protein